MPSFPCPPSFPSLPPSLPPSLVPRSFSPNYFSSKPPPYNLTPFPFPSRFLPCLPFTSLSLTPRPSLNVLHSTSLTNFPLSLSHPVKKVLPIHPSLPLILLFFPYSLSSPPSLPSPSFSSCLSLFPSISYIQSPLHLIFLLPSSLSFPSFLSLLSILHLPTSPPTFLSHLPILPSPPSLIFPSLFSLLPHPLSPPSFSSIFLFPISPLSISSLLALPDHFTPYLSFLPNFPPSSHTFLPQTPFCFTYLSPFSFAIPFAFYYPYLPFSPFPFSIHDSTFSFSPSLFFFFFSFHHCHPSLSLSLHLLPFPKHHFLRFRYPPFSLPFSSIPSPPFPFSFHTPLQSLAFSSPSLPIIFPIHSALPYPHPIPSLSSALPSTLSY